MQPIIMGQNYQDYSSVQEFEADFPEKKLKNL